MLGALAAVAAVGASAVVAVANEQKNRRRRNSFASQYPTLEEFRRAVDADRIRSIRDNQSELAAIRIVRKEFPGAPLDRAIKVVRAL